MLSTKKKGDEIFLTKNNKVISFMHDLKYKHLGYYRMVCEIPKGTKSKMEISTKLKNNPIIHDKLDGKKRYFKYGKMRWNYGAIPQTFEDPNHIYKETGFKGDSDPVDIIDIGEKKINIGEIIWVKILGALPLVDEGETDWKIIAINKDDPNASKFNDVNNISIDEKKKIYDWFINYKVKSKGVKNIIAMNKKIQSKKLAIKVIKSCNNLWKKKFKK